MIAKARQMSVDVRLAYDNVSETVNEFIDGVLLFYRGVPLTR